MLSGLDTTPLFLLADIKHVWEAPLMFCGFPAVGFSAVAPYESRAESESSRWFYWNKKQKEKHCEKAVMFDEGTSVSLGTALEDCRMVV